MNSYRHGALTIIETPQSHDAILRALKEIDPRLFLERQVTYEDQAVWCVVCDVGSDHPPITILEWRDSNDHPIHELSSGIVGRIARMDRDPKELIARVERINAERESRKKKETQSQWADIGTDFERLMSPGHSSVLHRGAHLRRTRDKMRAKGYKV